MAVNAVITKPPIWCAVDLRDGNQALIEPMDSDRKTRMFKLLCQMGFKEIEVGFPAASETDFDFVRELIEQKMIPDDVTIQVLTQSRPRADRAHLRGLPRRQARHRPSLQLDLDPAAPRRVRHGLWRHHRHRRVGRQAGQGSWPTPIPRPSGCSSTRPRASPAPSSSSRATSAPAVGDVYKPTPQKKMIINLPATVEMASANIYADQIEWCHRNFEYRDAMILSLHPHNDRGTGVAAAELGYMAGADRIEGCLFGNGERTGNVDLVTLGLNMFTQGVDPRSTSRTSTRSARRSSTATSCRSIRAIPTAATWCSPAFSGSHQDAINKGFKALEASNSKVWEVPYLPIDPADLGRSYEAIIRINSQSGKGGIAYILKTDYGIDMPRLLQVEFSKVIQQIADETGKEIQPALIWDTFRKEYLENSTPVDFVSHTTVLEPGHPDVRLLDAQVTFNGKDQQDQRPRQRPDRGLCRCAGQELRRRHPGARLSPARHRRRLRRPGGQLHRS